MNKRGPHKEVKLIYIGDRLNSKDGLSSVFVKSTARDKHAREEWFWFKKGTYWIGTMYKGLEFEDGMSLQYNERVGEYEEQKDIDQWTKHHLAATEKRKSIIAKEKVRKNPLKESELEFLRRYTEGLSWDEKKYLIEYIVGEIMITKRRKS